MPFSVNVSVFCKFRAAKYPELTNEKRAQNELHPFWFSLLGMLYIVSEMRSDFSGFWILARVTSFGMLHKSSFQRRPRFHRVRVPGIDVAACNLAHLRRQFRRCAISLQDRSSISSVRGRSTFRPCSLSSRSFMKQGWSGRRRRRTCRASYWLPVFVFAFRVKHP